MAREVVRAVCAGALTVALCASPARAIDDLQTLAKTMASSASAHRIRRVAVVPFTAPRGSASYDGAIVSERLVTQILARGGLDVVERRYLEKILEEQRLGAFGIMDPGTVKTLGKVLGVDAILTGSVTPLRGERVEINARLINAETAQILAAAGAVTVKDWEERPVADDLSTWIVPVPELPDDGSMWKHQGVSCLSSLDALEKRLLDFKARYWAERLKDPQFSLRSLNRNPGSEIRDPELRAEFYRRLRERYDAPARTPLTADERAELGRGLQELKTLSGICGV